MPEPKDPHLGAPGEANRDKHINFLAEDRGENYDDTSDIDNERLSDDNTADNSEVDNGFFDTDDATSDDE